MIRLSLIIWFALMHGVTFSQVKIIEKVHTARTAFGVQKLKEAIQQAGINSNKQSVYLSKKITGKKEGFQLLVKNNIVNIAGNDESGILYGCLELADYIKKAKAFPNTLEITDAPEMVLRGACIGLQKSTYLPGRNVYEYPITEETFPWFYDKKLWLQYLDSMVDNRMNSLYLWNGHPFASLVRLKDYPYAVEIDEATFKKNEAMYRFLTTEADKRGIWVIQMFYNIIVSKPFAEYNHIKTQDRERPIIPLIADYTRKSIAAFVEKYPNVGLLVCLGEAMEGVGQDDINWFTKTIIPGVKDGLKVLGKTGEPPIVLRAHDTDAPSVMQAALPLYKNLYTMAKFNGEALTYQRPRGAWAELHQKLSSLGSVQIENVHILANLEPFRYGSPDFIQQSVIGMHETMGGNGLHLYPESSYWDWPYSADSVAGKRLLQVERDWIWYKAWSRYAWKAKRKKENEKDFWAGMLASKYGCSEADGMNILTAYEESGEIAPKLLRRFGITDGNRQTLTLGMLMTQLINPFRYGLFTLLYEAESPEGEMLIQYAEKDWKGEKHIGETPVQIINEVKIHGDKAVQAISAASKNVTKNKAEFLRLQNDMLCYQALAAHYADKAEAALSILRYKYSNDIKDLDKALPLLQKSVNDFQQLVTLTKGTYLYANSMQTSQRKIPLRGVNGTFKTWEEVLVPFKEELQQFKHSIDSLKAGTGVVKTAVKPFENAVVKFNMPVTRYTIDSGAVVFADTSLQVSAFANELKGLSGVRLPYKTLKKDGAEINFSSGEDVKVLVAYFIPRKAAFTRDTIYLKEPELETNATADDFGQAEIKISNAIAIDGLPAANLHIYNFKAGNNTLRLGKGVCLILGIVKDSEYIPVYDAKILGDPADKNIDWLFE